MNWRITNKELVFTDINDEDCIEILSSLTDDGIGKAENGSYSIPVDGIFELTDGQRRILGLPSEYPYGLFIENDGLINRDGFKYKYKFTTRGENGALKVIKKEYPIITVQTPHGETYQYMLPYIHYDIVSEMDKANNATFVNSTTSYNAFAYIKNLAAADRTIKFNDYLDSYDIHPISNVRLSIDNNDGILEIKPELPDEQLESESIRRGDFSEAFDRRNKVMPVYTLATEDGKEHKVVLPENSTEALETLKSTYRHVADSEEIQRIIDSPESFLDEEIFDLREFYSDRVIEIGLYQPKFYGFVCPYKSEWLPGFTIEDRYNGQTNIILKDPESLRELKKAIDDAVSMGLDHITFRGYKLNLERAIEIYELALEQNMHPEAPVREKKHKKVLIIEDNAESLGYKVDEIDLEAPSLYEFHRIEGLKDEYNLKRHQIEGVAWLQHLVKSKSKGCLLADDMGLGKTIQTLCFVDWHNRYYNPDKKPYLIVAPVSLLDNWKKEIDKFMKPGAIDCTIVHGGAISRKRDDEDIKWLRQQNVILTNYETVRSCQFNICAVDYAAVILDEAQKIKTPGTYVTCAAKALKADFKIAMTGTPVENTFLDLWCIMDFSIPGLMGNAKDFAANYQKPLNLPDTDVVELGKELRNKMGVFFLRRQKLDVLADLPEKTDIKREIVMTPEQEKAYLGLIGQAQADGEGANMLELLYRLRRLSDSTLLVDSNDIEGIDEDDLIRSSAKIQETLSILDDIQKKGEKAIIFCIYKESQRMLQRIIRKKYGFSSKIINGDTKVISTGRVRDFENNYSRQQAIDDFESRPGFGVIIMSPIAAGMGLNVTAANHVIHFGRHWNPAKESQATDRAYRIGQDKPVKVYYPITTLSPSYAFASFDQTLDLLLMRKTQLADATLFPSEAREVKVDDFKVLFDHNQQEV